MFENLIVDSVMVDHTVVSYDGQCDDMCEDISELKNVCANISFVELILLSIHCFGFEHEKCSFYCWSHRC